MANSSPTRRQSYHWASPQRFAIEDIISEDRNSEARHRYLLETAKKEHERIREDAERVYREQLQREERQRLLEERRKEEERIRLEEQLAADRARLNALKAKKIEIPAPLPDPEPSAAPTLNGQTNPIPSANNNANPVAPGQTDGTSSQQQTTALKVSPSPTATNPTDASLAAQLPGQGIPNGLNNTREPAKPASPATDGLANNAPQPNGVNSNAENSNVAPRPTVPAGPDRYTEIHKNLKVLRQSMLQQTKSNPLLKAQMGDMRREIRKSVGQLTLSAGTAGGNTGQVWMCNSRTDGEALLTLLV